MSSDDVCPVVSRPFGESESTPESMTSQPTELEVEPQKDPSDGSHSKEYRLTDLFPNTYLPPFLNPMYADVKSPRELPLCWLGIPFCRQAMMQYAKNVGLDKPYLYGPWKGELNPGATWLNVCDEFRETTGVELGLKEVVGCRNLILAFFSNWEARSVTQEKLDPCIWLIRQMGYDDDARPLWYLDRDNFL